MWFENNGTMPDVGDALIDFELRDGLSFDGARIHGWDWSVEGHSGDIIKWRFHRPEDAAEYYKYPKTPEKPAPAQKMQAVDILKEAAETIGNRASERDKGGSERSMYSCVQAFNALTKHTLTEEQGWLFMVVLKMARSQGGAFKLDDYLDGAAYFALAGEAAVNTP